MSYRDDVDESSVPEAQPSEVVGGAEVTHLLDGQLEAIEGEEGSQVGRVEGGHDHDEEPPGGEEDARRVCGGGMSGEASSDGDGDGGEGNSEDGG